MSQESVEQQYRAAAAFSRHDLDAFLAICDPDVELVSRHLRLDGSGHLRGRAAVRRWWGTLLTIYPDFSSEIDKVQRSWRRRVSRLSSRSKDVREGTRQALERRFSSKALLRRMLGFE